jgi:hypothetical protein
MGVRDVLGVLDIITIVISVVALIVSIRASRRTARYDRSEHKPRLQLVSSDFSLTDGLSYSAVIENKSVKPVDIRGVGIAYGSAGDPKKRIHDIIRGAFYFAPGERERVICHRTYAQVQSMRQEVQPGECMFCLWIAYLTAEGDYVQIHRALGGYDKDGAELRAVYVGDTLT